MFIHKRVTTCDVKGIPYPNEVEGVAGLCRGATGRWCEVMYGGPEFKQELVEKGIEILTHQQAVEKITTMEGYNTIDF